MKLSLVVPCYNEEENVALFYKEAMNTFEGTDLDYELVFVNDGSGDGTLDMLKKLCSGPVEMRIISFSRNFGKEAAMLAGLEAAAGDYVTVIDADLQQKPSTALEMVRILESNPDIDVVAAYQESRSESKSLSFVKDTFYKVINKFSDTEFRENASDFRTFRRPVVDAITGIKEYFRFSKGIFSWVGFNTQYLPYTPDERANGETKWSFKKLLKYAVDGIESFTVMPLKIPFVLGALFILISVILFVIQLVRHAGVAVAAVFFTGGVILACLGIIGEYLAKTYVQGKNRPIYIIKENITNR